MKAWIVFILIFLLSLSQSYARYKFDSAHSIAVDGFISNGQIITDSDNEYTVHYQIEQQLKYTIGQLNGTDSVADLNRVEVKVLKVSPHSYPEQFLVHYQAKLFIAWPRYLQIPESYDLILPSHGSWQMLNMFYANFAEDEQKRKLCLQPSAHDYDASIFWYYYRPYAYRCPLKNSEGRSDDHVFTLPMQMLKSPDNTSGKFPEYEKVWEDNKLMATLIFGMNEPDSTGWDAGVSSFNEAYQLVRDYFGLPSYINVNLAPGSLPGKENPNVQMIFETDKGQVDIQLLLVSGIRNVDHDFRLLYNERTLESDLISYSGHSGLGANIRALARMGHFQKDQYQIFYINGCDTFAYVDDSLRVAHKEVNPGFGEDKFIDIITNAMPSYFYNNASSTEALLRGLFEAKNTYREILNEFSTTQKAVVTGEQDNRYPLPFYE